MPPDFTPKFQLVGQYLSQGKFDQARLILQRVLQQAPGHPDANNGMAIALLNMGQFEQALYFARRAAGARPDDIVIQNTLATLLSIRRTHITTSCATSIGGTSRRCGPLLSIPPAESG